MRIRVGCEFGLRAAGPTPSVWQVRPRPDSPEVVLSSAWDSRPALPSGSYIDAFGNVCDRVTLQPGTNSVRYDAVVEVAARYDEVDKDALELPVAHLPDHALVFLLPSRFCHPEAVADRAWGLFGASRPGWYRVQAVCDWVHGNLRYQAGSSTAATSAVDVLQSGTGVCRDFAHVAVTFCRSLNIPARYVSGYIPDVGVEPADEPMDFCSWFEVWLGYRWWTFDARNNCPRMGRVVIGRGRDAIDVAMVTTYGETVLETMSVWADENS